VTPGTSLTLNMANGNRVFVDSRLGDPGNGDNRIFLTIGPGTAASIEAGTWSFTLTGNTVVNGRFDAWIQRGPPNTIAAFLAPHENQDCTISTPGTARQIITAGSYVTRGGVIGSASAFSSRGPTRDGRPAPDVSAPGERIFSARATGIDAAGDAYHALRGTSMAAPHVAGAAALMLQAAPTLTQQQIKDCLRSNARTDMITGGGPNTVWGAGKLDAAAAFLCAAAPPFFGPWVNLGGSFVGSPSAVSWGPDRLDVFVIGVDGALLQRAWVGDHFADWVNLGGSFVGSPSAVSWGPDRLDVFVIGVDGALLQRAWVG
jgi:subtilisin family serine protease